MFLKSTIKFGFVLFVLLLSTVQINAQAGISFTAGLSGSKNHLEEASPGSAMGVGYAGAVEARFLGQDMYFVVQLQYGKYKLLPVKGLEFPTDNNSYSVGHGRIGMGFTLFRLGYNTIIRAKILGSLDKTLQYTPEILAGRHFGELPKDKMNDSTVGMVAGFGVDLNWIVFDIEYERGLINAFYKVPGSNFDYFSVRAGILLH